MKKRQVITEEMLRLRMYPIFILVFLTLFLDILLPGIDTARVISKNSEDTFAFIHCLFYGIVSVCFYYYVISIDQMSEGISTKYAKLVRKIVSLKCLKALMLIAIHYVLLIITLVLTIKTNASPSYVYYIFYIIFSFAIWPLFISDRVYYIVLDLTKVKYTVGKYIK